jgi:hypothetical protein
MAHEVNTPLPDSITEADKERMGLLIRRAVQNSYRTVKLQFGFEDEEFDPAACYERVARIISENTPTP